MTEPKPETLTFDRHADGVQIALLKPALCKRSPRHLGMASITGFCLIVLTALIPIAMVMFSGDGPSITVVFPLLATGIAAIIVAGEINWEREAAVLEITKGFLTFVRSGDRVPKQWPTSEITTVRAASLGTDWELQIQPKNAALVRALRGRTRIELQWTAALLRAALAPPRPPSPEPIVFVAGGECQVCGSPMEEGVVLCSRCRTPHHEECWIYNGTCSTYGCREIRFTRSP